MRNGSPSLCRSIGVCLVSCHSSILKIGWDGLDWKVFVSPLLLSLLAAMLPKYCLYSVCLTRLFPTVMLHAFDYCAADCILS